MLTPGRRAGWLIGLGLGAAIWLASPWITGHREPWDAEGGYYLSALLGSGVLGGLLTPRHWPSVVLGAFGGQLVMLLGGVVAGPAGGGLWPLGVLFLGFYSVLTLLGAVIGASIRWLAARRQGSRRSHEA